MLEDAEASKPWRFKIGDVSPLLPRKKHTSDDLELDKREAAGETEGAHVSLSDDEVFVKQSPKRIKSKLLKHSPIIYNNNYEADKEAARPRCLKNLSPEKRPGAYDAIPKKKVRFALPEQPADGEGAPTSACLAAELPRDKLAGCYEPRRLKRTRLAAIDFSKGHLLASGFPKRKKCDEGASSGDPFKLLCAQLSHADIGRKRRNEEMENETVSVKLLCAQFAHTDLGK